LISTIRISGRLRWPRNETDIPRASDIALLER
jgi:hypothetical protein